MELGTVALLVGALVVATGFALWLYRAREVPVDGAAVMVAARAAVIAIVLLLLINPRIPGGVTTSSGSSWILVDRSLSMTASLADGGETPWDRALSEVGPGFVVLFGETPERASIETAQPTAGSSRLLGGLRLAIEAGARDVRVVSDFRLADLEGAIALLERTGVGADFEPVGGAVKNIGIGSFEVGSQTSIFGAELELFGEQATGDSARIEILSEGRPLASQTVAVPGSGSRERLTIPLPSPTADGQVIRYTAVATLVGDGFADDNERVDYVRAGAADGGIVLISSAVDWEPRFLLPTLRDVTGFEGEGYLAVSDGRFLRSFSDDGSVSGVDSASVRRRAFRAEVVVVHSSSALDPWLLSWLPRLSRVIIVAPDPAAAALFGLAAEQGRSGEWYVGDEAPSSPISGGLSGVSFEGLPPLGPVLSIPGAPGWSTAVWAAYQQEGTPSPALLLGGGRQRVAIAAAQGWWRWAFREGPAREAYRRVWSAVAGWMMEGQVQIAGDRIEPVELVVDRGRPVSWRAPRMAGDSVRLRIGPAGSFLLDTLVAIDSTEVFRTAALPPGMYPYSVVSGSDSSGGRFDVQSYAPELSLPVVDVESTVERTGSSLSMRVSGGRRLRTAGWPYFLLIAVLSAEWLLRRRKGLR